MKKIKIIQRYITMDQPINDNYIVLVFTRNNVVVATASVKIPEKYIYVSLDDPYLAACLN